MSLAVLTAALINVLTHFSTVCAPYWPTLALLQVCSLLDGHQTASLQAESVSPVHQSADRCAMRKMAWGPGRPIQASVITCLARCLACHPSTCPAMEAACKACCPTRMRLQPVFFALQPQAAPEANGDQRLTQVTLVSIQGQLPPVYPSSAAPSRNHQPTARPADAATAGAAIPPRVPASAAWCTVAAPAPP